MYFRHNEDKSVVITERFIKTLKAKIYKNMTTDDSKSYLSSLNKLVDQYYNTYHHSVNKKPINAGYSALRLRQILKLLSLNLMIESELLSIRKFLVKFTLKTGQEKYFLWILFWNLTLGLIKLNI